MSEINTVSNPVGVRSVAANVNDTPGGGSAVSWAAIFAGAAGAAALSLLLVILGTGLGFSAVSPWSMQGVSATTIGFSAILWLSFTQLAASGMGGYLAGRLRTRWAATHIDEVYFRDTAHGFLTWALASLLTVVVTASVMGSIVSSSARAGGAVVSGAASTLGSVAGSAVGMAANGADESSTTIEYFVDALFRSERSGSAPAMEMDPAGVAREVAEIPVGEVVRIFGRALSVGELPQEDGRYIGQLIAERTMLSQQAAEQRVTEGFNNAQAALETLETSAREAADTARKASALVALWMTVALLIGAFTASLMAVFGGRQRDA